MNFTPIRKMLSWLPDKPYLQLMFFRNFGKFINFKHPKTYNEKLQWLKIYNRNPQYPSMVDKIKAKEYVSQIIGEQYIIPTLMTWENPQDIDISVLPDQFVLKWNHDTASIFICKDKNNFDINKAKNELSNMKNKSGYDFGREWQYREVRPMVFAEAYMEDEMSRELRDYKWFCFDGEPKILMIASDRQSKDEETKFDFYDMRFNNLHIINGHPNSKKVIEKPVTFDEMKRLAATLSKGMPHVRVDFYEVNGHVYFGELTFFHYSGMCKFEPSSWDDTLGDWIKLPPKKG